MINMDEEFFIDKENPRRRDNLIIEYIRLKSFLLFDLEKSIRTIYINDIRKLGKELKKLNTDYYDELDYKTIEKIIINYQYLLGVRVSNINELNNMINNNELVTVYSTYEEMYNIHHSKSLEELNKKVLRRNNG